MRKLLIIILLFCSATAGATVITAVSSGPWTSTSTWNCACIPNATDDVFIPNGFDVSIGLPGIDMTGPTTITLEVAGSLTITSTQITFDNPDFIKIDATGTIIGAGTGGSVYSGPTNIALSTGAHLDGPITITNGGLPIELLFFRAQPQQNSVLLSWASETEKNFSAYEIQRSANGTSFEAVATVQGAGTSLTRRDYEWNDERPFEGRAYYRLRAIDEDGTSKTFGLVAVDFDPSKRIVLLYPNPIVGRTIKFDVNFQPTTTDYLLLRSNDGSHTEKYFFRQGQNEIVLPENAQKGPMLFHLYASGKVFFTRVLID